MPENKTLLVINAIINKGNMAEVQTYIGNMMPKKVAIKMGADMMGKAMDSDLLK